MPQRTTCGPNVPRERIVRANYSATKCLETGSKVINLGNRSLHLNPGAELRRVLRQLQELFADVRQVLKEAKRVGSRMERRPYCEYITEIADTGAARVQMLGAGLFVDGHLVDWKDPLALLAESGA